MRQYPPKQTKTNQQLEEEKVFKESIQEQIQKEQEKKQEKKQQVSSYLETMLGKLSEGGVAQELAAAVEQSVFWDIEGDKISMGKERKNIDLVTENYKQEKFDQMLQQYHRVEVEQVKSSVQLKHVDLEKARQQQREEEEKMKEIRRERKLLEQKRKAKILEMERFNEEGERKEKEEKEQQAQKEKETRAQKSEQHVKDIDTRLQNRHAENEKFKSDLKHIQSQKPNCVQLKNDIMFQELQEKKKQLKEKRNLTSNPQLLSEDQMHTYNYQAKYESQHYKKYLQEFKVQKQAHISKKVENEITEKKLEVLQEKIKKKYKPRESPSKKEELVKQVDYYEKEQKLARRKLKGVQYDYIVPKHLNQKQVKEMAREYFEEAKNKGDRQKNAHQQSQAQLVEQEENKQIQEVINKAKEKRTHDLQYLEQAKRMGNNNKDMVADVLQDEDLSQAQKKNKIMQEGDRLVEQAQLLEAKMKMQDKKPVDSHYYLGKRLVKASKDSQNQSQETRSKKASGQKKMALITEGNEERVNDMYLHSIKAKLAFLENQKGVHV